MSNFLSMTFDSQGNEVNTSLSEASIQTKEEAEAAKASGPGYGAQIRDVNAENAAAQAAAAQINGDAAKQLVSAEAFEAQLAELVETDSIIQHLEGAGRPVPQSMRESRSQLNIQIQITGAGLPDDMINEITERVRTRTM